MQDHLGQEAFERLVHRSCDVSLAYGWLLHLLGCEQCRSTFVDTFPGEGSRFLREIFDTERPVELPELRDPDEVDRILDHLKDCGLASFLHRRPAPPPLAELAGHPLSRRKLLVRNCHRYHSLEVAQHFLDQSRFLWHDDAREGLACAVLGLLVLDHLSPHEYHPKILEDYRALGWGMVGNGQRIFSDLRAADASLQRAQEHLSRGTGDLLEQAEILSLLSSLRKDQERLAEALELTERSADLYSRVGDRSRSAGCQGRRVAILQAAGDPVRAVEVGEELLDELDVDELEPLHVLGIRQNIALCMARAGWALPALRRLRSLYRQVYEHRLGRLTHLRLLWSEAQVLQRLGELDTAEDMFCELREDFSHEGLEVDVAMLSLDLAVTYQAQKKRRRARRAAREALPRFVAAELGDLAGQTRQVLAAM